VSEKVYTHEEIEQLFADVKKRQEEEYTWRYLLWRRHGCESKALYGDDGEMQCSACGIDFKRFSPEKIRSLMKHRGKRLAEEMSLVYGVDERDAQ
jgi:hypothetical protein